VTILLQRCTTSSCADTARRRPWSAISRFSRPSIATLGSGSTASVLRIYAATHVYLIEERRLALGTMVAPLATLRFCYLGDSYHLT
jgi:hypothetical protein